MNLSFHSFLIHVDIFSITKSLNLEVLITIAFSVIISTNFTSVRLIVFIQQIDSEISGILMTSHCLILFECSNCNQAMISGAQLLAVNHKNANNQPITQPACIQLFNSKIFRITSNQIIIDTI